MPASVVVAGLLIALGLYFGLRARAPATPAEQAPATAVVGPGASGVPDAAPATTTASPTASSASVPPLPSTETSPASQVQAAAEKAFAKEKQARFVPKCWTPIVGTTPEPKTSTYSVRVSFDPSGVEVGRGISELRRGPSRSDVAQCLRLLPLGVKLEGVTLDAPTNLDLMLSFP